MGLTFSTADGMRNIIDQLPARAEWECWNISLPGFPEVPPVSFWKRSVRGVVASIQAQFNVQPHIQLIPEFRYSSETPDDDCRQYGDVMTGDAVWHTQANSPDGTTILPILISTDETCLTNSSGDVVAYPVTITCGNISGVLNRRESELTRAVVGYIPTDDPAGIKGAKTASSKYRLALHHAVMKSIFWEIAESITPSDPMPSQKKTSSPSAEPIPSNSSPPSSPSSVPETEGSELSSAPSSGINHNWVIVCGDRYARSCAPMVPAYPADGLEHRATSATNGCPVCDIPDNEMGLHKVGNIRDPYDTLNKLKRAAKMEGTSDCQEFLQEHRLKHIFRPWWEPLLARMHPHLAMTPDILHMIWQGLIKYLVAWITIILGAAELDARVRRYAPSHGVRHFKNGLTVLSQVTGREHRQIGVLLISCVDGVPDISKQDQQDLTAATRAAVDMARIAEYVQHDESTIAEFEANLDLFHKHKDVFIRLTDRENVNIPKIHWLEHVTAAIRRIGSLRNVSTDDTERSHIHFAKDPYNESNKKDPIPQMCLIVERREKVLLHEIFLKHMEWEESCVEAQKHRLPLPENPFKSIVKPRRKNEPGVRVKWSRKPQRTRVSLEEIGSANIWRSTSIELSIKDFIYREVHGIRSTFSITRANHHVYLEFDRVHCWERLSFHNPSVTGLEAPNGLNHDVAHCRPWKVDLKKGLIYGGRQDPVLLRVEDPDIDPNFSGKLHYS